MSDDVKWFRVIDPLSPLYGSDVTGWEDSDGGWLIITAMRRMDIFVGDRPFQLVAPKGESLGLMIAIDHLADSPIQVDVVEIDSKRPFGICLNESEMTRGDGLKLQIVHYERATQTALTGPTGELLGSRTFFDSGSDRLVAMFEKGDDQDDIAYLLKQRD